METSFRVQRGGLGVASVQGQVSGDGTCPFAGLRALVCPRRTCCRAVETSRERVGQLNTGSFLHSVSDGRARVRLRLPPLRAEVRFGLGGPINWRRGSVIATKRGFGEIRSCWRQRRRGRLERRFETGLIRSLAEGHRRSALSPSLARFSDARRSGTGFGQGSPAARQRSTLDGVERCGFRRRPWQHGGQPRVLSDPSRGERVETPAPSVLVMVALRSGSVRSPRRREAGLSMVASSPPTVDGEGRRTSVRRRTSPAAGVSLRCELGRGRTRRPAVVAHQLRPTGVLSRCARSRLAGTLAPSGGRLRGPRSVGVDAARREDLGAVAPILWTSVRGAGSSATGRLQRIPVGSAQTRWQHRLCTRFVLLLFSPLFTWTHQVEFDGRCWFERSRSWTPRGSLRGERARGARTRSSHVAGAIAGGNTRSVQRVKLACSRGNIAGRWYEVVSVRQPKGTRGQLR